MMFTTTLMIFAVLSSSSGVYGFSLSSLGGGGNPLGALTGGGGDNGKFGLNDMQCMAKVASFMKKNSGKFTSGEKSALGGIMSKLGMS